jgi:hypothetical protein
MVNDNIDTTGRYDGDDTARGRLYVSSHGNVMAGTPEARGEQTAYELLGQSMVIGSGAAADVRVEGNGVADRHITLVRYDDGHHGMRLVDAGLETRINGQLVNQTEVRLEDGYRIDIGEATLVYRHDEGVRDDTGRQGGEGEGSPYDA